MSREEKEVYLCSVDFDHEIGEASGGNTVYPSLDNLKELVPCWESCGVIKAIVIFDSLVVKGDITKDCISFEEMERTKNERYTKHYKDRVARLTSELDSATKAYSEWSAK